MLSYCSMKIIALCLLYFLQSHNGYIWKTSPFTARSRHLILKNSNQPEGFPKATSLFDLGRQKLKEEAAKLREEADREVLKSQENSTISEIHVAADVKGFVVEKAYIPESKENFPYFMNNGTISDPNSIQSKPSTKPLDIAFSGVNLKDLPSYEPLLNYLRVIRKFDIQKFDKDGIAKDDRYLSTEGEEESFYDDDFAKNSFIKIMKMQLKDIPDPIDDDLLFISTFNVVNYAFSKAKKPNSLFNIFEGPMSSLLQKVSFQDGSDLIDFYEALRDYVKWRNDPKVKSLFEQVDLIYGSSNDISSSLAFPRVPFGLRPAITDTSILNEKYWNYFLDANLTNTYPLSSYLTLLSTAYATNPSSSYSDSIIEETLQVLPAYFNALMKYNIKRLTEAGFPDISYVLQQKNRNLLDKLISVDEKLSKDIDRRLYLTAFLLVFENNQSADEKKLQSETDYLYKVFQRVFLWQTKFNNAGSTSTLSTNQLAALYQKYSQANEILIDKQKDRFLNPVNFLTNPTPPNNIFFQLLTRSNNQQHSLQSENQNYFRLDEEGASVIIQYQRVLQEFKAEQFKKDPFSGLVLSNELLPKNQDGIGIVEERIKKNWERKKLVKRDWLDEDFELYKLASLIYYRSLFGEEKVNILSLLDENDDDEDVNEEEDQELASIFERIVQESDPSIKSTNLSMDDFFKEFKNGVRKMKEQNKKGQAKKQQQKSINGDEVDLSDFLEKVLFDFDSDETQTKEEFERQSYSFLFFSMLFTPEDEKIERIFTVLRNYKTWRFSEVGKNLWQQATAEEEKRGKEDAEDDSIKLKYGGSLARSVFFEEPLEDFQYFYQNDYLIAPPFNAFYSILFNAYKLFGPSVKFSEIMTIFAKGSPQPYLITKSTKEGLKKLSSTKGEKFSTTKEADLAALLESTRKRIEENQEGIPKINQSSEDNPLLVSTSFPPTPKSDRNVTEVMENLLQSILVNNASSPTQELIKELAGEYGSEAERFVSTVFYQPSNEIALRKTVESLIDKLIVRENVDPTEDESEEEEFQNKGEKEEFTLTKQLADEIRLNILKDVNLHGIRSYKGAYILQSEISEGREAQELCRKIEKRFQLFSNYSTLVDYAIIYDELIPKDLTDEDLVKMALDRPRVTLIIHPKKWKTAALNRMENSRFVNPALTVAYLVSTITFAVRTVGQSLNPDDINPATFASNGLLPMIAVALSLQIFSSVVEQVIGKSKGLSMKSYFLPSFGDVFSFGVHNAVKELPKNRRDIFDTFLSGILPTLLLSFICMVAGLNSIKDLTVDQISHLPTISLGFLRSNHLIETFITANYPQLFYDVDVSKASTLLHLPWLTIAGMGSFVGNIFRLLPFDHASVGRKLSYAVFGSRGDAFFVTILGIVKVVLLLSIGLFSDMSLASLPKELLFQYLVLVSLLPENAAPLVSKNDVSEVGELRKIIYFFVMFFAFVCFLPSDWNVSGVQENVQSLFPNLF